MATLQELYHTAVEERADPRTKDWFLVHSPWPPFVILISYITISANARRIMKNREAYSLRTVLIVYNVALVILSVYMLYEYLASSYLGSYSLLCQPVDYSASPLAMRIASVTWWYFISKYVELLDTGFFILRKKFNQISFLHVYHHCTMPINWWLAVKYVPGGQSFFSALLNCFVHVIMYSYYALSCFGPHMQKYLWWKKYLTKLQLIQFVLIFIHCAHNFFADCDFPNWLNAMTMAYMISLIILFLNFYMKSYRSKAVDKKRD